MSDHQETAPLDQQPQPALLKVVTFVTRTRGLEQELLTLHGAGLQARLPETNVNLDETPAEAALRLVGDLTGETGVQLHRRLAVVKESLPADARAVIKPAILRTGPSPDATLMRFSLERGMRVKLTEIHELFARVIYEEYTLHEHELAIATRRAGWVSLDTLTGDVEHHLYHLSTSAPPGTTGLLQAPDESRKKWVPLSRVADLLPMHERWLDRARRFLVP